MLDCSPLNLSFRPRRMCKSQFEGNETAARMSKQNEQCVCVCEGVMRFLGLLRCVAQDGITWLTPQAQSHSFFKIFLFYFYPFLIWSRKKKIDLASGTRNVPSAQSVCGYFFFYLLNACAHSRNAVCSVIGSDVAFSPDGEPRFYVVSFGNVTTLQ